MWSAMGNWLRRLIRRPIVHHGIKAWDRFSARLGWQFAGALTYFSFLAVVPILMLSFSVAGFVLANRPDLLTSLEDSISSLLPGSLAADITTLLNEAIDARLTVGIIGLVFALYTGISWMGNLRSAIQAMWRPDFDSEQEIAAEPLWHYYVKNLAYLAALGAGIAISLALTTIGTTTQTALLRWLGIENATWTIPIATVGPILLAVATDTVIFAGIYRFIPPKVYRPRRKALLRGSFVAAIGFEVLKFALTYLLPELLTSPTAKIFGPIIGLLIFFNLTATVVLFMAAWMSTSSGSPSAERARTDVPVPHGVREHRHTAAANLIQLPETALQQLDRIASREGTTREALVRSAVAAYLSKPDSGVSTQPPPTA